MASHRNWVIALCALAAALAVAPFLTTHEEGSYRDAVEQERLDAGPRQRIDRQLVANQLPALVRRCRQAASAKVWPDKLGRFDFGQEPDGAVMFMSPRHDGMPVIEFGRTFPTAAGYQPVTPPVRGRVGVRGRFEHESWLGGGWSAADAYFCEVDVDGMGFDVRHVSIEVVR